jgi:hypothetical protein
VDEPPFERQRSCLDRSSGKGDRFSQELLHDHRRGADVREQGSQPLNMGNTPVLSSAPLEAPCALEKDLLLQIAMITTIPGTGGP